MPKFSKSTIIFLVGVAVGSWLATLYIASQQYDQHYDQPEDIIWEEKKQGELK